MNLHPIIDRLVVSEVAGVEIGIRIVLRMPEVVGGVLQIGCTLADGMLIEAIETSLVDDIEDGLLGVGDSQR